MVLSTCSALLFVHMLGVFSVSLQAVQCALRYHLLVSAPCRRNAELVEELAQPPPGSKPLHFSHPFASSGWTQFSVLMSRWLKSYWRNPAYNATRFAFCVVLGVLLGTIYLWLGSKR